MVIHKYKLNVQFNRFVRIEYKRCEKVYGWIACPSHMGNHEKADVLSVSF